MQVVALLGFVEFEGEDLLGIYQDRDSALAALARFRRGDDDHLYDDFVLEYREVDADVYRSFLINGVRREYFA